MAAGPENHIFFGESGEKYLFKCHRVNPFREFGNSLDRPCVYIFAKAIHNNVSGYSDYEVLYVGETESSKNRPVSAKHEKWEWANRNRANYICILDFSDKVDAKSKRKDIEDDLVGHYDPMCNKDNPFQ
ncbi:MAG: hypothetical protein OXH39_08390 [Candidatus Poribacteria bacterium]|nr:hypothetical protein [Candidatus Poribacteria bacterium]